MGRVLFIAECRRRIVARKGFDPWWRRFGIWFDENASVRTLDSPVVGRLARGNEDSASSFYELIMGIKGLGHAARFHVLDARSKMCVTDITLFLLDLVRFEAMFRLGWLEDYRYLNVPLLDIIEDFENKFSVSRHGSPVLSGTHPLYKEYAAQFESDRHSFVRRLIPEAIKAFCDPEDDILDRAACPKSVSISTWPTGWRWGARPVRPFCSICRFFHRRRFTGHLLLRPAALFPVAVRRLGIHSLIDREGISHNLPTGYREKTPCRSQW